MRILKKPSLIFVIIIAVVLFVILLPYIKTEYLTFRYGDEFIGLEQQTNMLESSHYHKVISYSRNKAIIFYVSDTGDLITFKKENNSWKIEEWKTIWSNTGSADNFYWPYYR